MINKPDNWEGISSNAYIRRSLPAGGYEARIIDAAVVNNAGGSQSLAIRVDITSGDYAGFFKRDFDSNPFYNKKWRGTARFLIPTDGGGDSAERVAAMFKAMTEAVEASNPSYKWEWDERSLRGLQVGILVRDKEYYIEETGNHGFTHEIYRFVDIRAIREGRFDPPKPKLLNGGPSAVPAAPMPVDPRSPVEPVAPAADDYPF